MGEGSDEGELKNLKLRSFVQEEYTESLLCSLIQCSFNFSVSVSMQGTEASNFR